MRVAVVGAGAVGGYFGARLVEAGHEVAFLARRRTLDALRQAGLRVESVDGDLTLAPVTAFDDAGAIGPVDAVLVCVKAWQVREAAPGLRPLLGPSTVVLPLQNGVEASAELAEALGKEPVLEGLCKILSELVAPGHIRHSGVAPRIDLAERDGRSSPRAERLRETLAACRGVTATIPEDVRAALWEKFLFIASFGGVGAVCRATAEEIRRLEPSRGLLRAAMEEVEAVALARGIRLRDGVVDRNLAFVDSLPSHARASMHRDIAEGRPSELDYQPGAVVRLARGAGVAAPVHGFLYAALLPSERRARA